MSKASILADLYKKSVQEYTKTPGEWMGLLSCVAKFHKRSFDNAVLIYAQKPDATQLATFDEWHDKRINRNINRGAKGIAYCDTVGFAELPGFDSGKNPLRSVEDAIEQNDNNLDGIINNLPKPVYRESIPYAREHDELDKYRADIKLNTECRDAIHAAINESRYDNDFYRMKDAAKQVVDTYGAERVELIMAKIVQHSDWDGRYSRQNKEWAKGFEIPDSMKDVYSNTHPCLLDGFLEKVREKPSVLEKLRNPAPQQERKKTAPKKSAEMER